MSDRIFDGERDYIGPYLRYLADRVGLRDWTIVESRETPVDRGQTETALACCEVTYGQKRATISFRSDWHDNSEDEFRATCVHELMHAHLDAISQPLLDAEGMLGHMAFTPIINAHTVAVEICADAIATEWSRHLPLPSEWLDSITAGEGAA